MVTRINYSVIKDLKPEEAFHHINAIKMGYVKDVLLRDLINEGILDKPVKDFYFIDFSPRGVYMFFDNTGGIRYIGQTNQSFYQRIPTQLDTFPYGGFGWNSMLRIMGNRRTGKTGDLLTEADHEIDFEEVINYRLLLIEVDRCDEIDARNLVWIEKILLKIYYEMDGTQLLNGRTGSLRSADWNKKIDDLIR